MKRLDNANIPTHVKRGALLYWAGLLTVGAAIIGCMGVPGQLPQSVLLAALLLGGVLIQIALALALVITPTRRLIITVVVVNGVAVLLWTLAHTTGLPVGFPLGLTLWRPEMLSFLDFFLPAMEGLALLLLLFLLAHRPPMSAPRAWRTILATLPAFLLINLLTWGIGLANDTNNPALNETWLPSSVAVSVPADQTTTIEYCNPGGSPLAMDVSEPPARTSRPAPVVFYIHGGAGITGYRQLWWDHDGPYLEQVRNNLLRHGFVVASIDYRLGPLYKANAQIEDAKCAVRSLRAHATELGINPQRIGVYGISYGAYIATMLGTAGASAGFDVGQYLDQSSHVQAVVDVGGLTDLTNENASPSGTRSFLEIQFGSSISSLRAYSPLTYVAPSDPPFLILHGTDNPYGRPIHSQELVQRLHAVGAPATLILVQHGGDGLNAAPAGLYEQPGPDTLVQMISDFFLKTLAP